MDVYNILYEQALSPAALDFLESSAMTKYNTMEIGERISSIMQSPYYSRQAIQHSLELGCVDYIKLSENLTEQSRLLKDIQLGRRSTRVFKEYISLAELSACLSSAYFITERFEEHSHHLARRSIASGGALYPIDLYYIALHTEDLESGVYAYNPHYERLESWLHFASMEKLQREVMKIFPPEILGSWDMKMVSGIMLFVASLNRVACKYGDRGLRFALMDVGSICQNLHLSACCNHIACCAIGGYLDHEINRFMQFQEPNELVLLTMFIGK